MVRILPYRRSRSVLQRFALLAAAAAVATAAVATASPVAAQPVVKCLDAAGNVTYQNSPCEKGQAARPIEMPKAENLDDTSAWEAAASDGKVERGMPKRWVLRSRGAPAEIRRGGPREGASEVWRYGGTGNGAALLVGFRGEEVVWVRDDARSAPPAPAPAAGGAARQAAATSGSAPTRGPQNRRFVIPGRYCEHVFAEIGVADREVTVPATATAAAGVRYYYEPASGDPSMRTVFSCIDGRVADVERTLVR